MYGTSFSRPVFITYIWDAVDFGNASDSTQYVEGPKGKKGRVVECSIEASEAFNVPNDGASAHVKMGPTGGTLTAVFDWVVGAVSANTVARASAHATLGPTLEANEIAADTAYSVTMVDVTGSGPTGTGTVSLTIAWY